MRVDPAYRPAFGDKFIWRDGSLDVSQAWSESRATMAVDRRPLSLDNEQR